MSSTATSYSAPSNPTHGLKQLQQNISVSAELSRRYWHTHNNIDQYTTVQLSNWMPPLNWPFISHHLNLKAHG